MRKIIFANNHIYHVYNRGVEKRKVFMEDADYLRFVHSLFEFNDLEISSPSNVRFVTRRPSQLDAQCLGVELLNIEKERQPRKLLVEILAFCLMPNHYHLLLRQRLPDGIVKFMHKIGTGYTNYFNLKYERVGGLFQGRFKAVPIEREGHFVHIPYYIHANPIDLIEPGWKSKGIRNIRRILKFLANYRWSTYPDYIGGKNFPSVTQREFLIDVLGVPNEHRKSFQDWLQDFQLEDIKDMILE